MIEPRVRLRVNCSQTIKEGWRFDSTAEIEYGGDIRDDASALDRLNNLLFEVDQLGRAECARRNAEDGR